MIRSILITTLLLVITIRVTYAQIEEHSVLPDSALNMSVIDASIKASDLKFFVSKNWQVAKIMKQNDIAVISIYFRKSDDLYYILAQKQDVNWKIVFPGTDKFKELWDNAPEIIKPINIEGFLDYRTTHFNILNHCDFPSSANIYRFPYLDNTSVTITRNVAKHAHNSDTGSCTGTPATDMVGSSNKLIVAPADGWIRAYEDGNNVCGCSDSYGAYNNTIVMEHSTNGEWTKYFHVTQFSVRNRVSINQFVTAGTVIGEEGDIGYTCSSAGGCGRHLHFEVRAGRFGDYRNPVFCAVGTVSTNGVYSAQSCGGSCPSVSGNVSGTWGGNCIVTVTGNITVPAGQTLTILAGTTVSFNGAHSFTIEGTLNVQGSSGAPVVFTRGGTVWGNFTVNGAANIDYCQIIKADNVQFLGATTFTHSSYD